jgi:hypothetical protein
MIWIGAAVDVVEIGLGVVIDDKTADSGQYLRDLVDPLSEVVVCDLGTRPGGPQVA